LRNEITSLKDLENFSKITFAPRFSQLINQLRESVTSKKQESLAAQMEEERR
jgi:hypothetical protein